MEHEDLDFAEDTEPEPPHTATKVIGVAVCLIGAVCAVVAFVLRVV